MLKLQFMKNTIFVLLLGITAILYSCSNKSGRVYNIMKFGASTDTTVYSTKAIQKAIDLCSQTGGKVLVPKGRYLCGTIFLKDNVNLYLENGSEILGSHDIKDYSDTIPIMVEEPVFSPCLIYASDAKNISITGMGKINGRGYKKYFTDKRPMLMRLERCKNVLIQNVTLTNSASWCSLFLEVEKLRINGVKVHNRIQPNNDGLDINGCKDVVISDCNISTHDDPLCGKSTTNSMLENMVVSNCIISSDCSGFKLGTSSKSGFRNISVSNCVMKNCYRGAIKLICVDGGIMENINISNIIMDNVDGPVFIRLGARGKTYLEPQAQDYSRTGEKAISTTPIGSVKNISISNIQAYIAGSDTAMSGILIHGLKDKHIKNIKLSDIELIFPGDGTNTQAKRVVPEMEKVYPEPFFFGTLPTYGMYARFVDDLTLRNVSFAYKGNSEQRPAVKCLDAANLVFNSVELQAPQSKKSVLTLERVSNVRFERSRVKGNGLIQARDIQSIKSNYEMMN